MANKGKRLGNNPLLEGVFTKTEDSKIDGQDSKVSEVLSQETQHSEILGQGSKFLSRRQEDLKGTNVRLPNILIDLVDELVRKGSRSKQKSRIPKEIWFQAALELFLSMPVDWGEIINEEDLRNKLGELVSRINSQNY